MADSDDNWFTVPTVDDNGATVIVTGRLDVSGYRSRPRNCIRVSITMRYTPGGPLGFPDDTTAELLEKITDAFHKELRGKNTALLTGIYTGGSERNWVFYTFSTDAFNGFLNRALAPFPLLSLDISAENDPDWNEYDEMRSVAGDQSQTQMRNL